MTIVTKPVGIVWWWAAVPFRKYARNTVYNYCIPRGKLKRLQERHPELKDDNWLLQDVHNTGMVGHVKRRKVSAVEYWLVVLLIWGWLDDDSNNDTYSASHVKRNFPWLTVRDRQYGNAFDLGDRQLADFHWLASWLWTCRNTAYNFSYLWEESNNPDDTWLYTVGKYSFGWKPDGYVRGVPYTKFICGVDL